MKKKEKQENSDEKTFNKSKKTINIINQGLEKRSHYFRKKKSHRNESC